MSAEKPVVDFVVMLKMSIPTSRRERTADGLGTRWVENGRKVAEKFVVRVNPEKLVKALAYKALRAKSGVTRLHKGAVEVAAIGVKHEEIS